MLSSETRGVGGAVAHIDPTGPTSEYDVAISYAREDHGHAVDLATKLEAAGFRVFFDRHRQAELWGADLHGLLDEIYADRARFVVVLASHHYGKRRWTIRECNAIRRRLRRPETAATILPITIGIEMVPGLPESLTRVDIHEGIDRIVAMISEKLGMDQHFGRTGRTVLASSRPAASEVIEPMNMHHVRHPHPPIAQVHGPQATPTFDRTQGKTQVGDHTQINHGQINHGQISHGIGPVGLSIVMLILASALGGMAWLAFDFVKHAPRNSDGSVTVLGITLPAGWVGEAETEPAASTSPPPLEPRERTIPGAPTRAQLEGVWTCDQNATVTFTEAGRVAIANRYGWSYPNTPFATWRNEPYEFISPRTMVVGGVETHIELSKDGKSMRIIGGKLVFRCSKETF